MRRSFVAAATVTALVLPASITAVVLSTPASAAGSSVTGKKLTGTVSSTITISKCTPKSKTNKSASAPAVSLATGGGTLTWSKSGQTTVVSLTVTNPDQGACKSGSSEYDVTGSVTGGTSTYTHTGDVVSGRACAAANGQLTLVKGTTMSL